MKQEDNNYPKKILFNGLGGAGQRHLRIFTQKLPEVVTVGARSRGKTPLLNPDFTPNEDSDLETHYGIKMYKNINEAYESKPDLAVISTPTALHFRDIIEAADRGINIFVEKPAAANNKEAKEIISAIEQNQVSFFTSYQRRFHPLIIKTKNLLDTNALGDILSVEVSVASFVPDWHPYEDFRELYACKKSLGGGVLRTEIHELDFLNWVFGEPKNIKASGGCKGPYPLDVEDTVEIELDYSNFQARVNLCFMEKNQERKITIQGSQGYLELDMNKNTLLIQETGTKQTKEYNDSMNMDGMFKSQLDYYLNDFNLFDKEYCNALTLNMDLVSKCLININERP